jgi:hypothetical protein
MVFIAARMAHRSHLGQARGDIMADRVKPYSSGVNYWLFATDPQEYSYDRLERDTATVWDGVTDYVDLKNFRDVETGEEVLIFHAGTEIWQRTGTLADSLPDLSSSPLPLTS